MIMIGEGKVMGIAVLRLVIERVRLGIDRDFFVIEVPRLCIESLFLGIER